MNKNEKFTVWDATHPQITEVKEYLDRLCGKTPLNLVYKSGNDLIVSDQVKRKHLQQLVGILISDDTMLHLRAFTYDDAKPLFDRDSFNDVRSEDIETWVSKNITDFSCPRPAREADIKLCDKQRSKLKTTIEILDYHGVNLPKFHWDGQCWLKPNSVNCCQWNGESRLNFYLDSFGDILIFSTYR